MAMLNDAAVGHQRPTATYAIRSTFLSGHYKGVVYGACAVFNFGFAEQAEEMGAMITADDALGYCDKIKRTAKGHQPPHNHPDQLFWEQGCPLGLEERVHASCLKAAKKEQLVRIEIDCNIMPCGGTDKTCEVMVPDMIVKLIPPGKNPYGIHVFGNAVPMHFGKSGKLCLLGDSSTSAKVWAQMYEKGVLSWDWEQ